MKMQASPGFGRPRQARRRTGCQLDPSRPPCRGWPSRRAGAPFTSNRADSVRPRTRPDHAQSSPGSAAAGQVFRTEGVSRRAAQSPFRPSRRCSLLASRQGGCVSPVRASPRFPPRRTLSRPCAPPARPALERHSLQPGLAELRRAIAAGMKRGPGRDGRPRAGNRGHRGGHGRVDRFHPHPGGPGGRGAAASADVCLAHRAGPAGRGRARVRPPAGRGLVPGRGRLRTGRAVTPRTKAIVLCHPHNPTGAVFREADLRALADLAVRRGLFFIADETY